MDEGVFKSFINIPVRIAQGKQKSCFISTYTHTFLYQLPPEVVEHLTFQLKLAENITNPRPN